MTSSVAATAAGSAPHRAKIVAGSTRSLTHSAWAGSPMTRPGPAGPVVPELVCSAAAVLVCSAAAVVARSGAACCGGGGAGAGMLGAEGAATGGAEPGTSGSPPPMPPVSFVTSASVGTRVAVVSEAECLPGDAGRGGGSGAVARRRRPRPRPSSISRRRTRWTPPATCPSGPSELTAASRIPSGQGSATEGSRSPAAPDAISSCGRTQPAAGGIAPETIATTTLIRLATPAADLVCPMFADTAPSVAVAVRRCRSRVSSVSSARSPLAVPAPCPSIRATSPGSRPAWA
jgi:hypothetical protein